MVECDWSPHEVGSMEEWRTLLHFFGVQVGMHCEREVLFGRMVE